MGHCVSVAYKRGELLATHHSPPPSAVSALLVFLMFSKAFFFATLLLAARSASVEPASGTVIPLPKRASLTTSDGVFDWDKAILQTVATQNKHRQNLINLKKNKGAAAFNEVHAFISVFTSSIHTYLMRTHRAQ